MSDDRAGRAERVSALGLCGSLRAASRSRVLLQALALSAPNGCRLEIADSPGHLPLFNPDIENVSSDAVDRLKDQVRGVDVIVISSPEYAHGVTGTIKNALDWLVSYEPFAGKPVVVLNPSHRAFHADHALREILVTMNARLVIPASIRVPVTGTAMTADALVRTEPFRHQLADIWAAIRATITCTT